MLTTADPQRNQRGLSPRFAAFAFGGTSGFFGSGWTTGKLARTFQRVQIAASQQFLQLFGAVSLQPAAYHGPALLGGNVFP